MKQGNTALHKSKTVEVATLLIDRKANIHAKNNKVRASNTPGRSLLGLCADVAGDQATRFGSRLVVFSRATTPFSGRAPLRCIMPRTWTAFRWYSCCSTETPILKRGQKT